jgi:hypothetical protein
METNNSLSRSEKLLLFLYEKGEGKPMKVRYEDIVVGVFKKYPHDFHLKDYPEYPDSGDMIHKPLYDAKKKGYLNAANKVFALTDRGLDYAKQLAEGNTKTEIVSKDRLSRNTTVEFARIKGLEGFELFVKGEGHKLTDNDFYDYLGVTVRTQKNAVIGRMDTLSAVQKELKNHDNNPTAVKVGEYHDFLMERNQSVVSFFTSKN